MLNRKHLTNLAIIACVVAAAFGNSLSGGFVWDDGLFIVNPVYRNFDLKTVFFSLANGLEYQPVRDLSFLLDVAVWEANPFGFHLTNVVLFAINCLLVYFLALEAGLLLNPESDRPATLPETFVPLLAALFFAVHPLRSEVVAWVTQRNTLLAGAFFFASCLLFLKYLRIKRQNGKILYSFALVTFVLALLGKAIAIVLPLVLLLFVLVHGMRSHGRERLLPTLPFWGIAALFFFLNVAVAIQTKVIASLPGEGTNIASRLALALQIPFFYLSRLLMPWRVSAIYEIRFAKSLLSPQVMASFFVLALLVALAFAARRKYPDLVFGGGWFLLTLIPVLNLFATNPVVADRYFYLPSFGIFYLLASCGGRLAAKRPGPKVVAAIAVGLLVPLLLLTIMRNRVWRNDIVLWTDTAHRAAGVGDVWYNLGRAWHGLARLDEALDAYLRALAINPYDLKSLDNAAALFPHTEEYRLIRASLVRDLVGQLPPYPHGIALIGHTSSEWRDPARAEVLFRRILSANPDSPKAMLALGNVFLKRGDTGSAAIIFQKVMETGRDEGLAAYNLACLEAASGQRAEAISHLRTAFAKGFRPKGLLTVDPYLAGVREDPEFRRLAADWAD